MSDAQQRFDWAEIHRQIEAGPSKFDTIIGGDNERAGQLLRERTAQLAAIPDDPSAHADLLRAVVLLVGEERYALPIESMQEVTKLANVAVVPETAAAALGILNWRGELVMAFDLAALLGIEAERKGAGRLVAIMRGEEPKLAFAVDGVDHVTEIDVTNLQPPDPALSQHADIFRGMTSDALVLIDETKLMARLRQELRSA